MNKHSTKAVSHEVELGLLSKILMGTLVKPSSNYSDSN